MSAVIAFLSHPAIVRVGWALVHFLWQGAAVAALLTVALLILRNRSPNARYLVACAALLVMLAAPVGTLAWRSQPSPIAAPSVPLPELPEFRGSSRAPINVGPLAAVEPPAAVTVAAPIPPVPPALWKDRALLFIERNLRWFVALWLTGVVILSIRLLLGFIRVQRIGRRGAKPVALALDETARCLAMKLGLRRAVHLFESALAQAPITIGWLRPVILLPASLLTRLTPAQLEAILAHELAHIRRCDYLVNLLQTVAETLLFYHPAVHWASRRIRHERELCCDDLAVALCGDTVTYARALTELAERPVGSPLAAGASGGALFARIRWLLGVKEERPATRWLTGAVPAAILLIVLALVISCAVTPGEKEKPAGQGGPKSVAENAEVAKTYSDYAVMLKLYPPEDETFRMPTEEEIEKLGPVWPKVPPQENAAYYLVKANKDLVEHCKQSPEPPGSATGDKPYAGDAAALVQYVQNNEGVMATLRQGLSKPEFQVPCLIFKQAGTPSVLLSVLADIRNLARFLSDAGFAAELQGVPNTAAGRYLECIRMGKEVRQNSVLIGHLLGIAVQAIGRGGLDPLIANTSLDEATLRQIIALSREAEVTAQDRQGVLRSEAEFAKVTMAMSPKSARVFGKDYDACVISMDQELGKPLPELLLSAHQRVKQLAEKYPGQRDIVLQFLGTLPSKWARTDLQMRVLQIRAAIALYEKQHGVPPDALAALVPDFLQEVPEDPFSGKPMRYARAAEGWKVWSVGDDLKDDGGEAADVDQKGWIGPDFVFTNKVRSTIERRSGGKILMISAPEEKGREGNVRSNENEIAPGKPWTGASPAEKAAALEDWLNCHGKIPREWLADPSNVQKLEGLKQCYDLYRLHADENAKLIPVPYPAVRETFLKLLDVSSQVIGTRDPDDMAFDMEGETLRHRSAGWGDFRVQHFLSVLTGFPEHDILGAPDVVQAPCQGDCVVRVGASQESRVAAADKILRTVLHIRARLLVAEAERPTIVVRGKYRYSPQPLVGEPLNDVEIYGSKPCDRVNSGGGSADFGSFVSRVGDFLFMPIISEADKDGLPDMISFFDGPKVWHDKGSRFTPAPKDEMELVFKHLAEQTGLNFSVEPRKMKILRVERLERNSDVKPQDKTPAEAAPAPAKEKAPAAATDSRSTISFIRGDISQSVNVPVKKVHQAAIKALRDLDLKIDENEFEIPDGSLSSFSFGGKSDASIYAHLKAHSADGLRVWVDLRAEDGPEHTWIVVGVGVQSRAELARQILEQITKDAMLKPSKEGPVSSQPTGSMPTVPSATSQGKQPFLWDGVDRW